jgi:hypothetical protein
MADAEDVTAAEPLPPALAAEEDGAEDAALLRASSVAEAAEDGEDEEREADASPAPLWLEAREDSEGTELSALLAGCEASDSEDVAALSEPTADEDADPADWALEAEERSPVSCPCNADSLPPPAEASPAEEARSLPEAVSSVRCAWTAVDTMTIPSTRSATHIRDVILAGLRGCARLPRSDQRNIRGRDGSGYWVSD